MTFIYVGHLENLKTLGRTTQWRHFVVNLWTHGVKIKLGFKAIFVASKDSENKVC